MSRVQIQTSPPVTRSRSRGRPRSRTTPEPINQGADQEESGKKQQTEGRRASWREAQDLSFGTTTLLPNPLMPTASRPRTKHSKREMAELRVHQSKSKQSSIDSNGISFPRHSNRERDPNDGFFEEEEED